MKRRSWPLISSLSIGILTAGAITAATLLTTSGETAAFSLGAAASASPSTQDLGPSTQDVSAAESTLSRAITLQQTMLVPPGAKPQMSKEMKATLDVADASIFRPTADVSRSMISSGSAQLEAVYTGAEFLTQKEILTNWAEGMTAGEVLTLGGGADSFKYDTVAEIDRSTLEIKGSARVWAQYAQIQHNTHLVAATPSSIILFDAALTLDADEVWRVSKFTWTFAPGSGP
ncbi:hypothetical protein Franean1_3426 [Parafrankia sp. EAN1pec]|uniref:hypothetical protein n=1 Tax=Parafrankia sp. (strain EAN1pec) TaxID=298653 RepID=UPI0000543FB6|nr:hypothetical protein Franean1_3426 [Frankia sp. EAN1pec]